MGSIRRSRASDEPILRSDGSIYAIKRAHGLQLEALKIMARHRLVSAKWLAALLGCTYDWAMRLLTKMQAKPHAFIKLCDEQRNNINRYLFEPLYYELTDAGIAELARHGIEVTDRENGYTFDHQVMVDLIGESLEIGFKENSDVRCIPWEEIREDMPDPNDRFITIEIEVGGKPRRVQVRPDEFPLGIQNPKGFLFLDGYEADRANEPLAAKYFNRSSIRRKYVEYLTIIESGAGRAHFNRKTYYALFFFDSPARMRSAMELLRQITDGRGSRFILFSHFDVSLPPDGRALTTPCLRVGAPPLSLIGKEMHNADSEAATPERVA